MTLVGGLVLLGSGGLTAMLGLVAGSDKHQNTPNPSQNYPSTSNNTRYYILGAGVGMMAASIPLFLLSKKYKAKYKKTKINYSLGFERRAGDVYANSGLQPTISIRLGK